MNVDDFDELANEVITKSNNKTTIFSIVTFSRYTIASHNTIYNQDSFNNINLLNHLILNVIMVKCFLNLNNIINQLGLL